MSPSLSVWLDIIDENDPLQPRDDGSVFIKCSRIGSTSGPTSHGVAPPTIVSRPVSNPFADTQGNVTATSSPTSPVALNTNSAGDANGSARPQSAVRRGYVTSLFQYHVFYCISAVQYNAVYDVLQFTAT